jgi:hypothetical protein
MEQLQAPNQRTVKLAGLQSVSPNNNDDGKRPIQLHSFDELATLAFQRILTNAERQQNETRKQFDIKTWNKAGNGGLLPADRIILGNIYAKANSVFEFGLGESTFIADHVGVPRYAGVDNDPQWVSMARHSVSDHFRFFFADVGKTGQWGAPEKNLPKSVWDYQVAPLATEPLPFDVYMVDGRWRVGCLLTSFLHASARRMSLPTEQRMELTSTLVLLHDCQRPNLHTADTIFDVTFPEEGKLCQYRRRPNTTDQDIFNMWKKYNEQVHTFEGEH